MIVHRAHSALWHFLTHLLHHLAPEGLVRKEGIRAQRKCESAECGPHTTQEPTGRQHSEHQLALRTLALQAGDES
jgi:hypothetical protein